MLILGLGEAARPVFRGVCIAILNGEALMAAARDQAARILRAEPETVADEAVRDPSADLADQLRAHLADEAVARRHAEMPERPAGDQPAAAPSAPTAPVLPAVSSEPPSGKRKLLMLGFGALLAL